MRRLVTIAALVTILAAAAIAAESQGKFAGKVVTVSVFKNGYGFFRMEGAADVKEGKVEISPVPAATLGTWWFYTRKEGVTIDQAVAAQRDTLEPRSALSLEELISANVGKEAAIETEKGAYKGTILANTANTAKPPTPAPLRRDEYGNPLPFEQQDVFGTVIMLSTGGGVVALRPGDVKSITVKDGASNYGEKKKEGYVTLYVRGAKEGSLAIGCQFLQKGIRWIPSYRVERVDDKTATLTLQGELIDDVQDLDGSTLQLVVGIPNFLSGELLSPLAYVSGMPRLSQFFQPAGGVGDGRSGGMGGSRYGYFSNSIMTQSAAEWQADSSLMPPTPADFAVSPDITSKGVSDLYYYTKENVTLKAGQRASLSIFSGNVPCRDIYKWNVVDKTHLSREDEEFLRQYRSGSFNYSGSDRTGVAARLAQLGRQDMAEHFIRLTDSTDKPLTSGPALVFSKGGDVMSQDVLNYTSAGGTVDVRITGAPDIKVAQKEEETSRNRHALNYSGVDYDQVNATVTLTVKNFKKETIRMAVTKPLEGVVAGAPQDATVVVDTAALATVNPHSRVDWEFDLEPGADKTLTLQYSTYVRVDR